MSKPEPRPAKISLDDIPWRSTEDAPTKVRIQRLITRGRHGSELTLGVSTLDPGERTNRWSSLPENDAGPGDTGTARSRRPTTASAATCR